MKQVAPLVLLAIGLVLVVASLLWSTLFSGGPVLAEDEYARLEELEEKVVKMYQQIESVKARTGDQRKAEEASVGYNKAIEERDALRSKLESGVAQPNSTANTMRYAGIGLLVVGVIASLVLKPS